MGERLPGFQIDPKIGLRLSYEHKRVFRQHLAEFGSVPFCFLQSRSLRNTISGGDIQLFKNVSRFSPSRLIDEVTEEEL